MSKWFAFLTAFGVAVVAPAWAETIIVHPDGSGDYPTIQAAVDAAASGDVIELSNGTFAGSGNCDVDLLGKTLVIRSAAGDPSACVIDCGQIPGYHRGFVLRSGEGPGTTLEALTIVNGKAAPAPISHNGGAILCANDASLLINRCVFSHNEAWDVGGLAMGGAIHAADADVQVIGCRFEDNRSLGGGALSGHFSIVRGCTFVGNSATEGGALALWLTGAILEDCTLVANEGDQGVLWASGTEVTLRNSIIAFNQGSVSAYNMATIAASCCDIYGNEGGDWIDPIADQLGVAGNISADPRFCDLPSGDLGLSEDSPCAPAANPECGLIGAWPVSCDLTPIERVSWGALKSRYRE